MTLLWEHFVNPFEQTEDSDFNITKTTNVSWLEVSFVSYWHVVKMFPSKRCWSTFDTNGCLPVGMWCEWLSCFFVFFFLLLWEVLWPKTTWKRFYFILQLTVHHKEKSGQELKAGPKAAAVEECYWLACSVCSLYIQRATCEGMVLPTVGGSFHINQENAPEGCLQASVVGDSFSWGSLFSDNSSLC